MSAGRPRQAIVIVTGTVSVPPGDLSGFLADVSGLTAVTRERDGNLAYDIAVIDASAGQLLVAERWRDEAALAAHLRAVETMTFVSRWADRLRGDVRVYDASGERPLSVD